MTSRDVPVATASASSAPARHDAFRPTTIVRPATFSLDLLWRSAAILPRYWDLVVVLTRHRIHVRYRQSALGPAWAILQPLAMMLIITVVFTVFARVPTGDHPYALFVYTGLLPWTAFAGALLGASTSLVQHATLVTRVAFPREVLPLTAVMAALCDIAIAAGVLGLLLVYYGVPLTWTVLWLPVLVAVMGAFCTAVSLALCALHVRFRDVSIALPLVLQAWMFASPVIYPLDAVPAAWRTWYLLNPMAGLVDGFRRAVLDGRHPDPLALGIAAGLTLVLLPAAYLWFKHVEATMADII
jgi:lipopolysaccharide transport system permease protein